MPFVLHKAKGIVEKGFYILKNNIDVTPAYIRKDSVIKGYLFIYFLSLILRMKLMRIMRDTGLLKKYSANTLIIELEKKKVMILIDGTQIVTNQTKRQKEILKAIETCA